MLARFDFAASAPYDAIDVTLDTESFFDAVHSSSHKFLGGPGSSGILVIHRRICRADLAPTMGARQPMYSFTIRVDNSWLHPRFVTMLLNDL